jgi:hypothetical protein
MTDINFARTDRTKLMNITDMMVIASKGGDPVDPYWGESSRVLQVVSAYYGGFNMASDAASFNRVRGQ